MYIYIKEREVKKDEDAADLENMEDLKNIGLN